MVIRMMPQLERLDKDDITSEEKRAAKENIDLSNLSNRQPL